MHRRLALLLTIALALSACSASAEMTTAQGDIDASTSADSPVGVNQNNDSASQSSAEIFTAIEDSIVFVESPDGRSSGSGIVIDGGWVLTNAHVVDRHASVQIGSSRGDDLGLHPVHATDWTFDLAVIGPIEDDAISAIPQGVSAELALGSRILLVGFPDEDANSPTPTLTEGIVSRRRSMALGNYPFLQVDATIAPGQSGGALVNDRGELVGISGLEFGEGEFGLAFASDPLWPRIDMLVSSPGPAAPSGQAEFSLNDQVGPLRNFGFSIEVDDSGSLDLLVASDADIYVDVQTLGGITVSQAVESLDPFRVSSTGAELYVDDLAAGGEDVIATLDPGTYQVVVGSFSPDLSDIEISSANPMQRFADKEEGQTLPVGEIVEGNFDWPRDTDQWLLDLEAGDSVSIIADGIADTLFVVRLDDAVIASSDDEGLGVFGSGSQVEFVADESGTYVVEVGTFDQVRWGYLIQATIN